MINYYGKYFKEYEEKHNVTSDYYFHGGESNDRHNINIITSLLD